MTKEKVRRGDRRQTRKLISEQPVPLIAHEVAHFFQMTATTYGIRRFGVFIEELQLKLTLIALLAQQNNGTLSAPIHSELERAGDGNAQIGELLTLYHSSLLRALELDGGIYFDRSVLDDATAIVPGLLFQKRFFSVTDKPPAILVNLYSLTGENKVLWLGARHVMEGAAAAIQMVQTRLSNEQSPLRASIGPDQKPLPDELHTLMDPYFVTNKMYSGFTAGHEIERRSTLEELYLLSDLALMSDRAIEDWPIIKSLPPDELTEALRTRLRSDTHPGLSFVSYLLVLAEKHSEIRRIEFFDWGKVHIINFQNDVRRLALHPSGIEVISENLVDYTRFAFRVFKEKGIIPSYILDALEGVFVQSTRFRSKVLRGGAHLEDLLSSKDNLLRMLKMVPGIIINNEMISKTHSPGMGIGVALNWLANVNDVADAIIDGDRGCLHDQFTGRICAADKIPLCMAVNLGRGHLNDPLHCVREEALKGVFSLTGIKQLQWPT